jgi:hypothetical protein
MSHSDHVTLFHSREAVIDVLKANFNDIERGRSQALNCKTPIQVHLRSTEISPSMDSGKSQVKKTKVVIVGKYRTLTYSALPVADL